MWQFMHWAVGIARVKGVLERMAAFGRPVVLRKERTMLVLAQAGNCRNPQ